MKTSEMIAMLENNPKLMFTCNNQQLSYGERVLRKTCGPGYNIEWLMAQDWELVRTPVTWQEAIQAWIDGKTITAEECPGCSDGAGCRMKAKTISNEFGMTMCRSLFKGKWYIQEAE